MLSTRYLPLKYSSFFIVFMAFTQAYKNSITIEKCTYINGCVTTCQNIIDMFKIPSYYTP